MQDFSLVKMLLSISQPICTSTQPNFYTIQHFHIHIQQASHISHMNLPMYNIRATAQRKNDHKKIRLMLAQESCDIWMMFQSFLLKNSTHTIHPIYFQKYISLFPKKMERMRYSITEDEINWRTTIGIFQ